MKLTHYIYISTALATLAACSDDDLSQRGFTVGEAENAIVLQAGVSEGGSGVQTRAGSTIYSPFSAQTQLRLRVDGTWTGHGEDPYLVSKSATAKTAASATIDSDSDGTDDTHAIEYTTGEELYWDDYGTADPANRSTGRTTGLTIYGVAVEGGSSAPAIDGTTGKRWDGLSWNVGTPTDGIIDQSGTDYWKAKDLLTSNNVTAKEGADGTYKFDARADGKLLKFTHAMTKMTVELRPGAGFASKFEKDPEVTLKGFYYTGDVDVIAKTSTPNSSSTADIKMHQSEKAKTGLETVTFDALVFPGNSWTNLEAAKAATILTLSADGNDYSVTAEQLYNAMTNKVSPSHSALLQGWNYKLVIIVNKTAIDVIATVVDWKDVTAEEEAPKINVTDSYGHTGTAFENNFDFFRSTNNASGYSKDAYIEYTTDGKYVWHDQLYWPTHSTHYFFRGVWPRIGTESGEIPSYSIDSEKSKISVQNVAYASGTYPSDLMMARPLKVDDTTADETCAVTAHKDSEGNAPEGICATEGQIRMNFHYMMSQVIVELSTSALTASDHVNIDANTKVEIVGGYKTGAIAFSGCNAVFLESDKGDYQMNSKAADDYDSYHDAIIPQPLEELKFRITVKNSDNSIDVYECPIKDIKVSENSSTPATVSSWEAGKKYTYNLTVKKTAIKVSATLTDWIPVEANQDVWF